ncbi:MAG: hypothetical protein ACRD0K_26095 [Egibacteraceae bacterium]
MGARLAVGPRAALVPSERDPRDKAAFLAIERTVARSRADRGGRPREVRRERVE